MVVPVSSTTMDASHSNFETLLIRISESPENEREHKIREEASGDAVLEQALRIRLRVIEDHTWLGGTISDLSVEPEDLTGCQFGRWMTRTPIDHGGMGDVYLAERVVEDTTKQLAALKVFRGLILSESHLLSTEFSALQNVSGHQNIVRVLDADVTKEGRRFIVMELIDGHNICKWAIDHKLPVRMKVLLFKQVLDAVDWVHNRGLVHRDIKPFNILVTSGIVKLLDFGFASEVDPPSGTPSGHTPQYASPEQRARQRGGPASDQYSSALVLREMLTGKALSVSDQTPPIPPAHQSPSLDRYDSKQIKGDLNAIIQKALSLEATDRYPSIAAFRADLDNFLSYKPTLAAPPNVAGKAILFAHREPKAFKVFLALVFTIGCVGMAFWQSITNGRSADRRANAIEAVTRLAIEQPLEDLAKIPGTLKAREHMIRALDQSLANLAKDAENNDDLRLALARAHLKLASVSFIVRGRTTAEKLEALRHCAAAEGLISGRSRSDAPVREILGEVLAERARWLPPKDAIPEWNKAVDVWRKLVKESSNDHRRDKLAESIAGLAAAELEMGEIDTSLILSNEEVEIREQLSREHPTDTEGLKHLARGETSRAWDFILLGLAKEAKEKLAHATMLYRDVAKRTSGSQAQIDLAEGLQLEGQVLTLSGRRPEALHRMQEAVKILRNEQTKEPDDTTIHVRLIAALITLQQSELSSLLFLDAEETGQEALRSVSALLRLGHEDAVLWAGRVWHHLAVVSNARDDPAEELQRLSEADALFSRALASSGLTFTLAQLIAEARTAKAAANWMLEKGKLQVPPTAELLSSFRKGQQHGYVFNSIIAGSWRVLGEAQSKSGNESESQNSLREAVATWSRVVGAAPRSSLFKYWYGERLVTDATLKINESEWQAATTALQKARLVAEEAESIDHEDLDIATLRVTVECNSALLAWKSGRRRDSDRFMEQASTLLKHTVQSIGKGSTPSTFEALFRVLIGSLQELRTSQGDLEGLKQDVLRWATWLHTEARVVIGPEVDVLRLKLLLGERAYRLTIGDAVNLECDTREIIAQGESLLREFPNSQDLNVLLATASMLAALGKVGENSEQSLDPTNEYFRKADLYRSRVKGRSDELDAALLLQTMSVRLMQAGSKSEDSRTKFLEQEIARWERLWQVGSHGGATRIGYAFALLMQSGLKDETDTRSAIRSAQKAEEVVAPIRRRALNMPFSWIVFGASFQLVQLYEKAEQPQRATDKCQEMLGWLQGGIPVMILRAAVVSELADLQEPKGAPESTAAKMEELLRDLKEAKASGAWRLGEGVPTQMMGGEGMLTGSNSFDLAFAEISKRLGSYRLAQADKASNAQQRIALVMKAGAAYQALNAILEDVDREGRYSEELRRELPDHGDLLRAISECGKFEGGFIPKRPAYRYVIKPKTKGPAFTPAVTEPGVRNKIQ
jgi:tetratricopeptide (TPR) repeat protein